MKIDKFYTMNKDIKYLIEKTINFNPVDYSEENNNVIDQHTITELTIDRPKDKNELADIIEKRMRINAFGDDTLYFPDLSNIDLSDVYDISAVFSMIFLKYTDKPVKLDLSDWNVSHINNMWGVFNYAERLIELNLSGWETSNVTTMSYMFARCKSLTELDLSGFDTSNVQDMS